MCDTQCCFIVCLHLLRWSCLSLCHVILLKHLKRWVFFMSTLRDKLSAQFGIYLLSIHCWVPAVVFLISDRVFGLPEAIIRLCATQRRKHPPHIPPTSPPPSASFNSLDANGDRSLLCDLSHCTSIQNRSCYFTWRFATRSHRETHNGVFHLLWGTLEINGFSVHHLKNCSLYFTASTKMRT